MSDIINLGKGDKAKLFENECEKTRECLMTDRYSLYQKIKKYNNHRETLINAFFNIFIDKFTTRDIVWLYNFLKSYAFDPNDEGCIYISSPTSTMFIDVGFISVTRIYIAYTEGAETYGLSFEVNLTNNSTTINLTKSVDSTYMESIINGPINFVLYSAFFSDMTGPEKDRWDLIRLYLLKFIESFVDNEILPNKKLMIKQHFSIWRYKLWH